MSPLVIRASTRDLLVTSIRPRRPRYEAALERLDRASLEERATRVRWIAKIIPRNILMTMPFQTFVVFQEVKATYIAGQFVATITLAAAFIEHWFALNLVSIGLAKKLLKASQHPLHVHE